MSDGVAAAARSPHGPDQGDMYRPRPAMSTAPSRAEASLFPAQAPTKYELVINLKDRQGARARSISLHHWVARAATLYIVIE